jgi:hypothetical protein
MYNDIDLALSIVHGWQHTFDLEWSAGHGDEHALRSREQAGLHRWFFSNRSG